MPLVGHHAERRAVRTAEGHGEGGTVEFDPLEDLAPLGQPGRAALGVGLLALLAMMAEGAILDWSAVFIASEIGAATAIAAMGYAAFSVAMTFGRLTGDRVVRKLGPGRTLALSAALAAAAILLALTDGTAVALLGFGLAGLGLANAVPVLFSAAEYPQLGARVEARVRAGELSLALGEPDRAALEFLEAIEDENRSAWLPRALHGMARERLAWPALSHLLVTHFHTDHVGDLAAILWALRHGVRPERVEQPLVLLGPRGLRAHLDALATAHGGHVHDPGFPVEVRELAGGDVYDDPHGRFTIRTHGTGLHEITDEVAAWLRRTGIGAGLVTLFCRHTSAGLLITENASPAVQRDLLRWLAAMAPEEILSRGDGELVNWIIAAGVIGDDIKATVVEYVRLWHIGLGYAYWEPR